MWFLDELFKNYVIRFKTFPDPYFPIPFGLPPISHPDVVIPEWYYDQSLFCTTQPYFEVLFWSAAILDTFETGS